MRRCSDTTRQNHLFENRRSRGEIPSEGNSLCRRETRSEGDRDTCTHNDSHLASRLSNRNPSAPIKFFRAFRMLILLDISHYFRSFHAEQFLPMVTSGSDPERVLHQPSSNPRLTSWIPDIAGKSLGMYRAIDLIVG
jgi:hypothetical protein